MDSNPPITSHSSETDAWLDCGAHGRVFLSRITPRVVVAKNPRIIPPCIADLVVVVDGQRLTSRVRLTEGFREGRRSAVALTIDESLPF